MTQFESLLEPHRGLLRGYVYRMLGHAPDAEDVLQDTLLKAVERFESLRADAAFKSWIFQIATRTCLDHLRKKKRWRPFSQHYAEVECDGNVEERQKVIDSVRDADHAYDVREHIAFCFTCVGRSLEPEHQAALVLREILGFSNREAADVLGVTESVLRHRLSDARKSMRESFAGLCTLVSKEGLCWQCASFRKVTDKGRKGPDLPVLSENSWIERVAIARENHFVDGAASGLQDVLFDLIARLES